MITIHDEGTKLNQARSQYRDFALNHFGGYAFLTSWEPTEEEMIVVYKFNDV